MRKALLALGAGLLLVVGAGAVQLRLGWKVGDELRYTDKVVAKGNMELAIPVGEQVVPIEARVTTERLVKVTEPGANGALWVEYRVASTESMVTVQGAAQAEKLTVPEYRLLMTALGDVKEIKAIEPPAGDKKPEFMLPLDTVAQTMNLAGFPAQDVKLNDAWDREVDITGGDGKVVKAKVNSRLTGLRGNEATIFSRFTLPIPPSTANLPLGGMDLAIQISGRSTGESTTTFEVAQGRILKVVGSSELEFDLALPGSPAKLATAKFAVDMSSDLKP